MRTRKLGPLEVTVVGLGCNNFGGRIDEAATRAVVDAALDAGVTFFDTADIYGNAGGSEALLGRVLAGSPRPGRARDEVRQADGRRRERRGSRDYIRARARRLAARLQTDVIDLYQHHEEDPDTPLEETFGALDELVDAGNDPRVRHVELRSRATLERAKAIAGPRLRLGAERVLVARARGGGGAAADVRAARARLHPVLPARERPAHRQGRAGQAAGRGHAPLRPRDRRGEARRASSGCARGRRRTACRCSRSRSAAARRPPVASVIAGATKPEQVRANAAAGEWEPTRAELNELLAGV